MRAGSIKFHINPYGSASSAVQSLLDEGALEPRLLRPISSRHSECFQLWIAFSEEMDEAFVRHFREHSTREARLLIVNVRDESQWRCPSTDMLLIRLLGLQIRSPERIYVADFYGSGKSHCTAVLLQRLFSSVATEPDSNRILDAKVDAGILHVVSPEFKRLDVPISRIGALANASPSSLADFEIDEDGSFICWPKLDVHLGWEQLQQVVNPEAARKALQKDRDFNVRYGKAVQLVREQAGLKLSDIEGISEKQLRRIEKGECRLTSNAIETLAKAYHLAANDYLKKLADTMS